MPYLRLIRFPNLLIVALTQFLLQYLLILPAFQQGGVVPILDLFLFAFLVLSTILIAASGYVINDLVDYPIDLINKPKKVIINRLIPEAKAWRFYYALIGSGFLISLYLAWYVDNLPLVLIYPTAVALLYWYSKKLKATVLWGNFVVGLFCAFVAGIVLFAERQNIKDLLEQDQSTGQELIWLSFAYLLFAFLSTVFREVIKDMEDVLGDQQGECRTLPIVYGLPKAKIVAAAFGLLLLESIRRWGVYLWQDQQINALIFLCLGIAAPLLFALYRLWLAKDKKAFHFLSQFAKYIILSGILYLFTLSF